MPKNIDLLTRGRIEALFASTVETGAALDRPAADRAIREATLRYDGVRGCATEMGGAHGDSPEWTLQRLQWVRDVVFAVYPR